MKGFVTRQPIIVRLAIAIVVVGVLRLAALFGWIPAEWVVAEDQVQDWIDAAVGAWALLSSRRVVTPVAAPRDNAGRELVPSAVYPPR